MTSTALRIVFAVVAAALASCATVGTPTVATQVALAKGEYAFEATYNVAANLYLANEAYLPAATKAQAKSILLRLLTCRPGALGAAPVCTGLIPAARAAEGAANAADLGAEVGQITALVSQVTALVTPALTPPA